MLNRFTLDYSTFQRVKITDRVTFPHLINLNNYLKGYENIAGKQYDKEVERMQMYQKDKVQANLDGLAKKNEKLSELQKAKEKVEVPDGV